MDYKIISVNTESKLNSFIKVPWTIYKENKCWVPPMIKDMKHTLDPEKNPSLPKENYVMFMLLADKKPAGRIFAGIDTALNEKKNGHMGYISLFECIDEYKAAEMLFDSAITWLKDKGITLVRGPVSPTGSDSDESKGLLINAFDRLPVFMTSYNPSYYENLFLKYGFVKEYDLFAYYLDNNLSFKKDPTKVIQYAMNKYNYRLDPINLNSIETEIKDLKYILDLAVPDDWPDMVAPSVDDIREVAMNLKSFVEPNLVLIARSGDEPIGFAVALPDYNQVLIHMNGRITPLSIAKFLWYKRKIKAARLFIVFVIPTFRKKGVSYSLCHQVFKNAYKYGVSWGEGSTIGETNLRMRNDMEGFGAKHYKTYRVFKKDI